MRGYISFMRCGFLEGCAYRNNFIVGLLANFIKIVVLYYVWKSIFMYKANINGYNWQTMQKYILVSFLCNSAFSFGFEMKTARRIINGDIIFDMLRPISYRGMLLFKLLGTSVVEFSITLVFVLGFCFMIGTFGGISIIRLILFLIALLLGLFIKFEIQYLFSLLCFYTDNSYGVVKAREILTNFFSGALIPISMFPHEIQSILLIFPFKGIVYTPCSIFIGIYSIEKGLIAIIFQIIWCVVLWKAGTLFWNKAFKVISVYGG